MPLRELESRRDYVSIARVAGGFHEGAQCPLIERDPDDGLVTWLSMPTKFSTIKKLTFGQSDSQLQWAQPKSFWKTSLSTSADVTDASLFEGQHSRKSRITVKHEIGKKV